MSMDDATELDFIHLCVRMVISGREHTTQRETPPRTATASLALYRVTGRMPRFSPRQPWHIFRHRPEALTSEKSDHAVPGRMRTQIVTSQMDKV